MTINLPGCDGCTHENGIDGKCYAFARKTSQRHARTKGLCGPDRRMFRDHKAALAHHDKELARAGITSGVPDLIAGLKRS